MSPEVLKLAAQCIVSSMGGQRGRYLELVRMAMELKGELTCKHCGELLVDCRFGNKGHMEKGYVKDCSSIRCRRHDRVYNLCTMLCS